MASFDFSWSNLTLKIGGQILFIVIALMLLFFGNSMTFPKEEVKAMIQTMRPS